MINDQTDLTSAELNIVRMLAGNMFDSEIKFALEISDENFKEYIQNILEKLEVSDRDAAAEAAVTRRLINTEL